MAQSRGTSAEGQAAPLALPPALAGSLAALWSVTTTVLTTGVLFVVAWVFSSDPAAEAADAFGAAMGLWLLSHNIPITAVSLSISLPPLLVSALYLLVNRTFAKRSVRATRVFSLAGVLLQVLAYAFTYGVLAVVLALLFNSRVAANSSTAFLAGLVWGLVGGTLGVLAERAPAVAESAEYKSAGSSAQSAPRERVPRELVAEALSKVPDVVRQALAAGVRTVFWLGFASIALTLALLIWRYREVDNIISVLASTQPQSIELWALLVAYLPVMAIWVLSALVGPGVTVGGATLSLVSQTLGPLPALPFLALLPAALPSWATALWLLPMVAAGLGGWRLTTILASRSVADRVLAVLIAALTAAVVSALLLWLARGDLGAGRFLGNGPAVALGALSVFGSTSLVLGALSWARRKRD